MRFLLSALALALCLTTPALAGPTLNHNHTAVSQPVAYDPCLWC